MTGTSPTTISPYLKRKLDSIPNNPGIYQFKNSTGVILYIGKAINLRRRVRQYFQKNGNISSRINVMVSKVADIELIITDSEVEALILEATLIKKYKPHYNIDLKDDKSYPYIVITKEPYPRIFVTRRVLKDGSQYFGPYTEVRAMRESLKMVREIFKVRSCNYFLDDSSIDKKKYKLCLDYQIKRCDGPCEGLISEAKYNEMIQGIALLLKGKTAKLISELESRMTLAADGLKFEEAKHYRDGIRQLTVYEEKQKVIDPKLTDRDVFAVVKNNDDACGIVFSVREGKITGKRHSIIRKVKDKSENEIVEQYVTNYYLDETEIPYEIYLSHEPPTKITMQKWLSQKSNTNFKIYIPAIGEKVRLMEMCKLNAKIILDEYQVQKIIRNQRVPVALTMLQQQLHMKIIPQRIECFDISNIQGKDSVASMVVFINGKPHKSEYRRFKIESVEGANDFASIREVIFRRYKRVVDENLIVPDLIIVDGGKGQLSSAVQILESLRFLSNQNSSINIIGLAKRLEEVFLPGISEPQNLPKNSPSLRLLQRIRNEAHRFAITYHRRLRTARTITTEIQLIDGVGKKNAKLLLEMFGSVQGVKFATTDQLKDAVGMKVASIIRGYFNDANSNDEEINM